jgi:hypothetical protein
LLGFGGHIDSGASKSQVRVLVHTQPWGAPSATPFSAWGNPVGLAAASRGAAVEISGLAR